MTFKDGYDYQNKLRLFVYGTMAAPLVFFAVIYLRSKDNPDLQPVDGAIDAFTATFITGWLLLTLAAYWIFYKRLKGVRTISGLEEKLSAYFNLSVYKFSFLEGAMLLSAAGYFIKPHQLFAACFVVSLFIISVESPSLRKTISRLRLNQEDRKILLEKDGLRK